MAPKRQTATKALRVEPYVCPGCHNLVITVETDGGRTIVLNTKPNQTWVLSGRETESRIPIAVPSRSYVIHKEPCP